MYLYKTRYRQFILLSLILFRLGLTSLGVNFIIIPKEESFTF